MFYPKEVTRIALKGHNNKYVCSDDLPKSRPDVGYLTLTRDCIGKWETFQLINLGNNKVALKDYRGKYVYAVKGGRSFVLADPDNIGPWETFELMELGNDMIALKFARGYYLESSTYFGQHYIILAEGNGNVPPGDWAIFTKIKL
ncbi:hypothetical protein GJU41_22015 [Bacillus idriensis]|uniref:Fascin domain-containing protein n=1 Tax=Metabacillus idriensis TaxID=324768 RepID=A0A6I2ME71_9BACI|nr:hypothetical protein [Metabacillus idriensis]MRX56625.1 hypothetical protein [Metabacillus idriensis]